jgi:hypothetical protein
MMGGFVRFVDGDWSWNLSTTRIMFDLLVDRLPDGDRKTDIAELRDNNVLMLDLRDPSQDQLVEIIADNLYDYVDRRFAPDIRQTLAQPFEELHRLAVGQLRHNQKSATERDLGGG